jgi:Aspartyl protease
VAVAFERFHHLVLVPAVAGGIERRFVLDTGIGPTLLTPELCAAAGGTETGARFSGPRMSGQEITLPLARVPSLRFDTLERRDLEVGVFDLRGGLPPELADIGGFLSLAFFDPRAFTVDYPAGTVSVASEETLAARVRDGVAVDVALAREGPSLDAFLPLVLPGGHTISAEVDMGSDSLILDERFAAEVGVDLDAPDLRRAEGADETGARFRRTFATLAGSIHPSGAPELAQERPEVMFQRIVHDGLVGDAFLRRQAVTYDLARSRLILGARARARARRADPLPGASSVANGGA